MSSAINFAGGVFNLASPGIQERLYDATPLNTGIEFAFQYAVMAYLGGRLCMKERSLYGLPKVPRTVLLSQKVDFFCSFNSNSTNIYEYIHQLELGLLFNPFCMSSD